MQHYRTDHFSEVVNTAVILAGGFGTRLRTVVSAVPKPMAPVGNRPFLDFLLRDLATLNFDRVVMCVGYKAEAIIEYFGTSYAGMTLEYQIEDSPLGTGGAIRQALERLATPALVLNGDTYIDMKEILLRPVQSGNVIFCKYLEDVGRYGVVVFDGTGLVEKFEPSTVGSGYINTGVYLVSDVDLLTFPVEKFFSWEEFLSRSVPSIDLKAEIYEGDFIDIGVPADYYSFVERNESTLFR